MYAGGAPLTCHSQALRLRLRHHQDLPRFQNWTPKSRFAIYAKYAGTAGGNDARHTVATTVSAIGEPSSYDI